MGSLNRTRTSLSETERALLATWRELRKREASPLGSSLRLDPVEQRLVARWREWRSSASTCPPWVNALRHHLNEEPGGAGTPHGSRSSASPKHPPDTADRLLGLVLGGAVGEVAAGNSERTSAALFVLDGLIRARGNGRSHGASDPIRCALDGLQRWLHTRGVAWEDCLDEHSSATPGTLDEQVPHSTKSDDPAMLTALARVAAGQPHGTRHRPINNAGSATAVPLGALAALWSNNADTVLALAGDLAALTHGAPEGHLSAGAMALAIRSLLQGEPLHQSCAQALLAWKDPAPESLALALKLGQNSPAGFWPGRTQLEAMGAGLSGVEALNIAIRVALACQDNFATAVLVAADHGGDAATSAMLCGQLLGALHGPAVVPRQWLGSLQGIVEQLADEMVREFRPSAVDHPDVEDPNGAAVLPYRTGLTAVAQPAASRTRFLGAVLGCAVGEALGTPIAAESWDEIRSRHGEKGLSDYVPAGHPAGRLGSDTQLLLFSLEGTIRANISRRQAGSCDPMQHIQHAYQRWLHTQHLSWGRAAGEFLEQAPEPDGWLIQQRALFQTRNPGRTMMRTLIAFAKGQQSMGTPELPVSDSKGSTAVMRAVPAALWSDEPAEVFRLGMNTAALTHGHPLAYLSAGALAFLVARSVRGENLGTAAEEVLGLLGEHTGHQEIHRQISTATRLASSGPMAPMELERSFGSGATAPEALGIGLYAALVAESDFDMAVCTAVNHSGRSAITGAIGGSLMGAMLGAGKIPPRWVADLELAEVVERLGDDATLEFSPHPPQEPDWFDRYPAT